MPGGEARVGHGERTEYGTVCCERRGLFAAKNAGKTGGSEWEFRNLGFRCACVIYYAASAPRRAGNLKRRHATLRWALAIVGRDEGTRRRSGSVLRYNACAVA